LEESALSEQQLIAWALKDDKSAIECLNLLSSASQTLDDLYDQDKKLARIAPINMVMNLTVLLHRNEFFRRHSSEVINLLERAIRRWLEASDLEEKKQLLCVSYVIRSAMTDLTIDMAYLVGGPDWGRSAAVEIRKFVYTEPFEDYLQEHS